MIKRLMLVGATVATAGLALTSTATAGSAPARLDGLRCVKAGVTFLAENNLLKAALLRQIDYSDIDSDLSDNDSTYTLDGPINTDLPDGSNLSLWKVVSLHYTNPELFDWCS